MLLELIFKIVVFMLQGQGSQEKITGKYHTNSKSSVSQMIFPEVKMLYKQKNNFCLIHKF